MTDGVRLGLGGRGWALGCLSHPTVDLPKFAWRDEDEGRIRWFDADEEQELLETLRIEEARLVVRNAIVMGMRRGARQRKQGSPLTKGTPASLRTPRSMFLV